VIPADWAIAVQIVTAICSVCGLFFLAWQIKAARKNSDLVALQTFFKTVTELEDRLLKSKIGQEKEQVILEFINFLEVCAAADNRRLFPKTTSALVVDKLCSSIAAMQLTPEIHELFKSSITTSTTFNELGKFMQRNRSSIADRALEMKRSATFDVHK